MFQSETLIPLTSGAYQARGYVADALICENLFPEANPQDTNPPVAVTHYPREGERPWSAPPNAAPGRGLFALSNGNLIAVVGPSVYYVNPAGVWTLLGQIANLPTPVSIKDNGNTAILVDNTPNGYTIALSNNAFAPLVDGTGTFVGATRIAYSDTYFALNAPGTNQWYVSNPLQATFNILQVAAKATNPDPIETLAFNVRQAWLIGSTSSEVWFLAGSTPFPYQEWPNIFIPYGCAANYSLTQADVDLFWLSRNFQGQVIAVKTHGLNIERITTSALEYEWSNYPIVSDCIASSFQQAGHTFIVFHFPTANKSWGYDIQTKQWHRRISLNALGQQQRENATFYASVGGPVGNFAGYAKMVLGQDWQTGQIYSLDPTYFFDGVATPIICRRTFPHLISDMKEITHVSFVADFEAGEMPGVAEVKGSQYKLQMRYSNDGGNTWSPYRQKGLVTSGNYRRLMRWRGLGMARDRVYELLWSYPGKSALQGAYVDPIKHGA